MRVMITDIKETEGSFENYDEFSNIVHSDKSILESWYLESSSTIVSAMQQVLFSNKQTNQTSISAQLLIFDKSLV